MGFAPAFGKNSGTLPPGSVDADEIADGSVTTAKLADPAGMPTVRRAARVSSSAGIFVSWAPSTATAFTLSASVAGPTTTDQVIVGRTATGYGNVVILSSGAILARNGVTTLGSTVGGVVPSRLPISVSVAFTATTAAISINGTLHTTLTFASQTWSTTPSNFFLGCQSPGNFPVLGPIWDLHLIDPASAANSAFFALDGDLENTLAGSSVADATYSGVIRFVPVLSTGGSKAPLAAIGFDSYRDGANTVALGLSAANVATGSNNVSVGYFARSDAGAGANNVGVGGEALRYATGNNSVGVGSSAGRGSLGSDNVWIGESAGSTCTGSNNVAVGKFAMSLANASADTVCVGRSAGQSATGSHNTLIGHTAGMACSGNNNVAIGKGAASSLTSAGECTYIGRYTGSDRPQASNVLALSTGATLRFLFDGTNYFLPSLPTADPAVKGALWNNAGVLTVSA